MKVTVILILLMNKNLSVPEVKIPLSIQRALVQSLAEELSSCMPHDLALKKSWSGELDLINDFQPWLHI